MAYCVACLEQLTLPNLHPERTDWTGVRYICLLEGMYMKEISPGGLAIPTESSMFWTNAYEHNTYRASLLKRLKPLRPNW